MIQSVEASNFQHASPSEAAAAVDESGEPKQLYCLCRTSDDSFFMIGCDKCDQWYHPECLGLDLVNIFLSLINIASIQSNVPDLSTYEFTCPSCKAVEEKKQSKSKKASAIKIDTTANKRVVKATEKLAIKSKVGQESSAQKQ